MVLKSAFDFVIERKMRSLQAPVVCPAIRPRQVGACGSSLVSYNGLKPRFLRSQFWGNRTKGVKSQVTTITLRLHPRKSSIKCVFSSHSDGTGSTAENFNENDEEYVNSSVVEAGKLKLVWNGLSEFVSLWFDFVPLSNLMYVLWFLNGVVEVRSGADGFMVKMRDGRQLRCVHNNPQGGHLPDYAPHPAIVLKMEDGTGLLLPIIVCT